MGERNAVEDRPHLDGDLLAAHRTGPDRLAGQPARDDGPGLTVDDDGKAALDVLDHDLMAFLTKSTTRSRSNCTLEACRIWPEMCRLRSLSR